MDDTLVYSNQKQPGSQSLPQSNAFSQPVSTTQPAGSQPGASPQPVTTPSPPAPPLSPAAHNHFLRYKKWLKMGVFIVLLLLVGSFLITRVMFPMFSPKDQQITLTFWGLWDDPSVMKSIITDFEKKHPLIKVTYVRQDIQEYRERLATRIPNGEGPDIYFFHNSWTGMMGGLLSPLPTDIITPESFQKTYYPVAQYDLMRQGGIYGIPLGIDTLALFVNTDLKNAAGVTIPENWDDFDAAAQKMTVRDEMGKITTAGASMGSIDNIEHSYDILSLLFVQNGVKLHDITSSSEQVIGALKFYTKYLQGDTQTWDSTLDPALLAFSQGKVGFYFGYSWDVLFIKQVNENLPFTIHEVPSLPNRDMTIASYWAVGTSIKSKHQKESQLFLSYLTDKNTIKKLYEESAKARGFGLPYARVDLAKSLLDDQILGPFIAQAPLARSTYFSSNTYDNGINTKMNAYLGNAVRSVNDNSTSVENAVEIMLQGVEQVAREYGGY